MAQKEVAAHLESLKTSVDIHLNTVVQTMQSSNENFDGKINTLNHLVANMKQDMKIEIGALKTLMEYEKKQRALDRALNLTDLESFECYRYHCKGDRWNTHSSELAKSALKWFLLGCGFDIPRASLTPVSFYSHKTESEKKAIHKDFAVRFAKQIKVLIQREPRLVEKADGMFEIRYE